ncbi:MAG: shikimate kinase [Thermodesulfobacteriota bacterium]
MSKSLKNIILTGFMATGKSSVGSMLAERLSLKYVDTDTIIEDEAGLSISDIFKRHGEGRFRDMEKDVIRRLSSEEGLVISVGGGAVVDPENISLLREKGIIISLTASPEEIVARTGGDETRPLLSGNDRLERIKELLKEREVYYSRANLMIDTSCKEIKEVVEEIIGWIKERKYKGYND